MKTRSLVVVGLVGMSMLAVACGGAVGDETVAAKPSEATLEPAGKTAAAPVLNLSHIVCEDNGMLDVHFVLLFWGDSEPGVLTTVINGTTYTQAHGKHSGNVWHYDVEIPAGAVDVTSASVDGATFRTATADYWNDTYTCGTEPPACSVAPSFVGTQCVNPSSIGGNSPSAVCKWLGLVVDSTVVVGGRDDGPFTGDTTTSLETAYVAVVKGGSGGASQLVCGAKQSVYNVYENVTKGQTLSTGNGTGVSDVTYCRCPDQ